MIDRLKGYLEIAGEVGKDVEMRIRDIFRHPNYSDCASDAEIARVYQIPSEVNGRINEVTRMGIVPEKEMVERLRAIGIDIVALRDDFELFNRSIGCDKALVAMGDIKFSNFYNLPLPKISEIYLHELEIAVRSGEVDFVMIDDGRVHADEMAFQQLPALVEDQSFDEHSITLSSEDLLKNMERFENITVYRWGLEALKNIKGREVRLLAFNTRKHLKEQEWHKMDTIRSNLPDGPFKEYLDVGTYLRLMKYLTSRKDQAVQGSSGDELFNNFFYGNGLRRGGMTPYMVLNHFFRGGVVLVMKQNPEANRYVFRPAPLFEGIECDQLEDERVIVPQVLSSTGDANINLC